MGVYERDVDQLDEEEVPVRGFDKPLGAWRLHREIRSADRELMLIADLTRGLGIWRGRSWAS